MYANATGTERRSSPVMRVGISACRRDSLKKLEKTEKTTNKISLVTIDKWAFYQSREEKITNK